jgi:iron complex outermembrane receptor protein
LPPKQRGALRAENIPNEPDADNAAVGKLLYLILPSFSIILIKTVRVMQNYIQKRVSLKKHKHLSRRLWLAGLLLTASMVRLSAQTAVPSDSLAKIQLSDVEIKWVRPSGEMPFAGTNVNRDQINGNIGNGSINNLFENIPSMLITSDAGNGIGATAMRLRGIDHTRINVTLNGIELNDAESQGTWFVNLPNLSSYTQNLTLQRGVGTSTNGAAAFGGSINFETLESNNDKPFLEVSSSAGSFYTFKNSVAAGTGLVKQRFSATAFYSNLQSRGYVEHATANLNSAYFTAQYRLLDFKKGKDYGTLRFNLMYGNEKTGLAWNGTDAETLKKNRRYNSCGAYFDNEGNEQHYNNETDNYQQTHYQLFYNYKKEKQGRENLMHTFDLNVGLHLTRGIGYYEQYKDNRKYSNYDGLTPVMDTAFTIADTVTNRVDTVVKELKKDLVVRKFLDNYFYGFTFNFSDEIRNTQKQSMLRWTIGGAVNEYDGKHYGDIVWTEVAGGVSPHFRWYKNTGRKFQANIYGKIEYMPLRRLLLYGDVQYRYIDYSVKGIDDNFRDLTHRYRWANFVNPKAGISYYLDSRLRNALYFSFALSHREPTRSDIVDAPADRVPVAETLYDFELGYSLNTSKFAFNANLYYMYYHDQLVLTGELNDVGDPMMTNVDKSYRTGIELVASYRPVRFFLWRLNGTFSLNKILNYKNYVIDYDTYSYREESLGVTDIAFSPNVIAGNEFVFTPLKNFDIALQTRFVSRQYLDNSSSKSFSLKPYSVSNLQLSYTIHTKPIEAIRLFFTVNNLFNMKYESTGSFYQYMENGTLYQYDAYNPQAGVNFLGGISLKF